MLTTGSLGLLAVAVFGASMLQAATGIGYGVIAGPIFLIVLNGSEAFQISTAHNFLIAVMLMPAVFRSIDRRALKPLLLGSAIGIPAGFLLQAAVSVVVLKLVCAAAVAGVALALVLKMVRPGNGHAASGPGRSETAVIGALAGSMGGMLAMPGPLASTWMSIRGWQKSAIRATILAFFVFTYGAGMVLHLIFSDIASQTITLSALLAPAAILGIFAGDRVSSLVSEAAFRAVLLVVLTCTVASLVVSI